VVIKRLIAAVVFVLWVVATCPAAEPINIGSRLELFVDDYLIDTMTGAKLTLHPPVAREVVIRHDAPWEGNISTGHTIFQDGSLYRMYYRGGSYRGQNPNADAQRLWDKLQKQDRAGTYRGQDPLQACLCYAESEDGIHWTKPELGLAEYAGSKKNNILWRREDSARLWNIPDSVGLWRLRSSINCSVFKDSNPACPPDARYKMLGGFNDSGSCAFKSADGIHFTAMSQKALIPSAAPSQFGSQTTVFWDSVGKRYLSFHRAERNKLCDTVMNTSTDFLHWSDPVFLEYTGAPPEELYTNQIIPYFRAPHIFMGFPKRFTAGRKAVDRCKFDDGVSDGVFMTSRDGVNFHRWGEAFLRPGPQPERWVNRNNYISNGIVVTKSDVPGTPDELSIYSTEGYFSSDNSCRLRRHTMRIDGFVSVQAPLGGGEFITRPIIFEGRKLVMNYSTSAAGSVRVELQTAEGKPIEGFTLAGCGEIYGDQIERVVAWKGNSDLGRLTAAPVRLRFVLKDADLYSIQFRP
jgi:hypothetical protein